MESGLIVRNNLFDSVKKETMVNKNIFKEKLLMVGARGFEPPTSWSRTKRAYQTALRPESSMKLYHIIPLGVRVNFNLWAIIDATMILIKSPTIKGKIPDKKTVFISNWVTK